MPTEKAKILEQLELILIDKAFTRSKISSNLLRYLVNASLENKDIRELTIGEELFGSDYDPIKSDNKVRVYVYNLRKKLSDYYENKAGSEEIIFSIEKGQYQVQFSAQKEEEIKTSKLKQIALPVSGILLIAFVFVVIQFRKAESNPFWTATLENKMPTTVLYGDFYTITGPLITNGTGMTRDFAINSDNDLEAYFQKNPDMAALMHASPQPYLGGHVPFVTKEISSFFNRHDYEFGMNLVSRWDDALAQTNNIVYFGAGKCMGVLEKMLTDAYPQYRFYPQTIERIDPATEKVTIYKDVVSYVDKITDYTIVAKMKMPAGNQMSFFLSDQDCGAISAIKYFSNTDSVKQFYKTHHVEADQDFIALFKVSGWLRKSYEMDFLLLDLR